MKHEQGIIIHGGAGRISGGHAKEKLSVLAAARDHAWKLLCDSFSAEDAVAAALRMLEESEYFNAGYGGYPNEKGIVLLDAGMMLGTREFASVVNVRRLKYPSAVVLDMLHEGKTLISIWTHELMQRVDAASDDVKARYGWVATHEELLSPFVVELLKRQNEGELMGDNGKGHDTVGCVVRDSRGMLCSGTSTGGIGSKINGRVGDSPLVGAGLFADNEICALSTSGHGESILLSLLSGFIVAEMRRRLQEDPGCFEKNSEEAVSLLNAELLELSRKAPGRSAGIIVMPVRGMPVYAYNSHDFPVAMCAGTKDRIRMKGEWLSQPCNVSRVCDK